MWLYRAKKPCIGATLKPKVVGSIPTRPTAEGLDLAAFPDRVLQPPTGHVFRVDRTRVRSGTRSTGCPMAGRCSGSGAEDYDALRETITALGDAELLRTHAEGIAALEAGDSHDEGGLGRTMNAAGRLPQPG